MVSSKCLLLPLTSLISQVAADDSEVRKIWVLQASILHIIYGAYSKDSADFAEVKRLLRTIVDVGYFL